MGTSVNFFMDQQDMVRSTDPVIMLRSTWEIFEKIFAIKKNYVKNLSTTLFIFDTLQLSQHFQVA